MVGAPPDKAREKRGRGKENLQEWLHCSFSAPGRSFWLLRNGRFTRHPDHRVPMMEEKNKGRKLGHKS